MIIPKKNILVYGAGSIGSYLAAKLYASGHNVDVIGRNKAKSIGNELFINDEAYSFPKVSEQIDLTKKYDYIFVTSKYYDLHRNLEDIVNSGVKVELIVLLQNTYIDNSWYIQTIKNSPFIIMSVFEGFNLNGNKLIYKSYSGWFVEDDLLGRDVYNLLKASNLPVNIVDDLNVKRAEKTVINCASNILSALEKKTIKESLANKETLKISQAIFEESYDILSEIIPMHSKRSQWKYFLDYVKPLDHYASTCQDVLLNKRTEIAFLNGFIIELGRKLNIPTPKNQEIVNEFRAKYPDLY